MCAMKHLDEGKLNKVRGWIVRFAAELERSPLSQITFVLAVAGTIVGIISAWSSVIHFIRGSWITLILSLAGGILGLYGLSRYSARTRRVEREGRLRQARQTLNHRLDAGLSLTRQEALDILRQEYPDTADSLLSEMIAGRCYEVDYAGNIRRSGP